MCIFMLVVSVVSFVEGERAKANLDKIESAKWFITGNIFAVGAIITLVMT